MRRKRLNSLVADKKVYKASSLAEEILVSFSVTANIERVMRTGRPRDAIGCLDGMRYALIK